MYLANYFTDLDSLYFEIFETWCKNIAFFKRCKDKNV